MNKIVNGVANDYEFPNLYDPNISYSKAYTEQLLAEKDKEIERLNNIIDELEKWITFSDIESFNPALNYDDECKMDYIYVDDLLDKLKELKEGKQ